MHNRYILKHNGADIEVYGPVPRVGEVVIIKTATGTVKSFAVKSVYYHIEVHETFENDVGYPGRKVIRHQMVATPYVEG